MKKAIIIHGMPDKEEYFDPKMPSQSNMHWIPWVQRQLILNGVLAQAVEMPEPYSPDYSKWATEFEQFDLNQETVLIGHSCGAGFLVRWLSENKVEVNTLALVAPWLDPDKNLKNNFFDFEIDEDLINRVGKMLIFYSIDDYKDVLDSIDILKKRFPRARFEEFDDQGHFVFKDMKTQEFPKLMEMIT